MFRIGVLASTNGSTLQAIIDEISSGALDVELSIVGSNKECFAIERSQKQGFETFVVPSKGKSFETFNEELLEELQKYNLDLIVLCGYMKVISPSLIQAFPSKIINVHPSLIPKYCGKGFYGMKVHEAVLKNNEKETGMTIHYVDEGVDTGEILCQKTVAVDREDTPEILKNKVVELEKKYYPEVIRTIMNT